MWLFGRSKGSSYKPVQRQVSITTSQEGPADRGDRYSTLANSPTSFPSSAAQQDDSASSFEQFNISNSSANREPLDPCTWSNVTSPGFATRVVNQANSSPLKEFNNGTNNPLSRSVFSGSPNRHLKLGQLPYSSWRQRQHHTSPLQFPPSPNRRSRGRYSDNGTVFVRIAPVDPEKTLLSPIPGSPVGNLPNLGSDSFSRSPPNGGLGGIPQTVLSAKFQRLWPSTNPIDRSLRMAPSSASPGILEALAKRKRTRATDVYVDKTTTPMRSSMINTDDCPTKGSKRVKFLPEDRNNRSLSMVPLHDLQGPDDGSMTSESILEQMNQTEKRFLPDEDTPASIRMLPKKKSAGSPRSSLQPSPFKKKKSPNGISIVERDPKDKNDRFCTCTECYEEAAGVSSLIQNISPSRNDRSFSQPGNSKKSVTFNLSQAEAPSLTKSTVSVGTETDIMSKEIIVIKSAAPSGGIIDMAMYKSDKIRRAERLRKILSLDDPALQDPPPPESLRETASGSLTLTPATVANNTAPFSGFGINTMSNTDVVDGQKKDSTSGSTFSFPQGDTAVTSGNLETKDPAKPGGFSFGVATTSSVPGVSAKETESPLIGSTSAVSQSGNDNVSKLPLFGSTSAASETNTSTTTSSSAGGFSFGLSKDTTISKDPLTTSSFTPSNFSFGSANSGLSSQPTSTSLTETPTTFGSSFGVLNNDKDKQQNELPSGSETASTVTSLGFTATTSESSVSSQPANVTFNFGQHSTPVLHTEEDKTKEAAVTAAQAVSGIFGSTNTTSATSASNLFSFGNSNNEANKQEENKGGFSFGSSVDKSNTSLLTNTSRLSTPVVTATVTPVATVSTSENNSFTFGASKPEVISNTTFASVTSSSSGGFSFGNTVPTFGLSASKPSEAPTTTAPIFGNSGIGDKVNFAAPNVSTQNSSMPSMGQTSTAPSFSFEKPTTTATNSIFSTGISGAPISQNSAAPPPLFGVGSTANNSNNNAGFPQTTAPSGTPSLFGNANTSGFPSSTTPTFGQNTTTLTSPFVSPSTTANSNFGQQNTIPTFGQTQNNPTTGQSAGGFNFGSNNVTSTSSNAGNTMFNTGTNQQSASQPSMFGGASNTMNTSFGQSSAMPSQTNNLFNTSAASVPNVFGQNQNASASLPSAAPSFGNPTGASPFGQSAVSSSTSAFGQNANNQPSANIFKPNPSFGNAAPNTSFSQFGQQSNPTPSSGFGPTSGSFNFGSNANSSTSNPSIFGSPAQVSSPTFGSAVTSTQPPAFGSSVPTFGSPATGTNNTSAFGASGTSNPPAFGTTATSNPPPFGTSTTSNPPAFGSQMANQSGFGSPSGGAFNFQGPAQTTQNPGFSFAGANANNNNNNNPQGLFQFGQQAQAQTPQGGGFNFTPQTNFSAGMPQGAPQPNFTAGMPQTGAPMFSLGSTNTTPSARRRDARPRRYR